MRSKVFLIILNFILFLQTDLARHDTGKCFYYYDDFCLLEKLKGNLMEAGEKYSVAEICYNGVKEKFVYLFY